MNEAAYTILVVFVGGTIIATALGLIFMAWVCLVEWISSWSR